MNFCKDCANCQLNVYPPFSKCKARKKEPLPCRLNMVTGEEEWQLFDGSWSTNPVDGLMFCSNIRLQDVDCDMFIERPVRISWFTKLVKKWLIGKKR